MRILPLLFTLGMFGCGQPQKSALQGIPVGQTQHFEVDTDRTMKLIKSGNIDITIGTENADGTVNIAADYLMNLKWLGKRQGTENMSISPGYFHDDFWPNLRASGTFVDDQFSVDWLGYEDASTMDGNTYPDCDKVKIYNMNPPNIAIDISKLVVIADISYGHVPGMGAVKLDVSGVIESFINITWGADYQK